MESSIALAAVAGSPLGSFIVQSIDIWFNHCNRTNGEAVNKETLQRVCRRYVPCYCSLATDVRSHKAGGGDDADKAVVCDWLVGGV